jgi:hypothetical protein
VATRKRRRRSVRSTARRGRKRARSIVRSSGAGGIMGMVKVAASNAAVATGGKVAVNVVRSKVGFAKGSTAGSLVEAAAAIGLGAVVARFGSRAYGEVLMMGGLMSPMETLIKDMGLPGVSGALGDTESYNALLAGDFDHYLGEGSVNSTMLIGDGMGAYDAQAFGSYDAVGVGDAEAYY